MTHETPQEESLPRNVVLFAGDVGLNTYEIIANDTINMLTMFAMAGHRTASRRRRGIAGFRLTTV